MAETTEARPAAALRLPRLALSRVATADNAFAAGVAACTVAVACFLSFAVTAWPPHEDETLALFAGRGSLADLYDTVFRRGGAPLHFTIAWVVAHSGAGLYGLRAVSAIFAVASVPVVAVLGRRLAGRGPALVATVLASASWMLCFHGVYARMYTLFLFTSALSYLALLRALDRGGRRAWTLWALAILATTATHTYGAIVIASQGLYALATRTPRFSAGGCVEPAPLRRLALPFGLVLVLGIPLWYSDIVLAGRFDVGVGAGGAKLRGPVGVLRYFFHAAGDDTGRWPPEVWTAVAAAALGGWLLARRRPRSALLAGCVFATPFLVFVGARVGSAAAPATRHLIFALPFFLVLVGVGVVRALRLPVLVAAATLALAFGSVRWGMHRNPELYRGEPAQRVTARETASRWLAGVLRPDDVLLGFDPLFLGAWEDGGRVPRTVVPRADPKLALEVLRDAPRLGRAFFVLDASDTNNWKRRLHVPAELPLPRSAFAARAFGPFLVVHTLEPVRTPRGFLERARAAEFMGTHMVIGDAETNYHTVVEALKRLDAGY